VRFTLDGVEVMNSMNGDIQKNVPFTDATEFKELDLTSFLSWRVYSYELFIE
jgi:hypothetical protein